MPPRMSTSSMFQSVIRTRARNKNVHPGEPDQATKRRSHAEIEEIRAQKAEQQKEQENRQSKALVYVANVEDKLRQDDIDRQKSAEQPKAPTPVFRPEQAEKIQG
jgi:galactose-1-phosphate uridylyltransferase